VWNTGWWNQNGECILAANNPIIYIANTKYLAFNDTGGEVLASPATPNNLLTSLQTVNYSNTNSNQSITMQYLDIPNLTGSLYYGVRYNATKGGNTNSTINHIRNYNMSVIKINS
jgi:hypothetical protein